MGVLADFYVARESRADGYDTNPEAFGYRASYKNITEVELSTLWAIISDRDWTADMFDQFETVLTKDNGERMIFKLPPPLVSKLAEIGAGTIPGYAAAWAKTDELRHSAPAELEPIIQDLVKLARHASEFESGLYLWNCV